MAQIELTKPAIIEQAQGFGTELVGFAPVKRWQQFSDVPVDLHPRTIWPQAKTVIVLAVPLWLPLIEAAPSVLGREQVIVTSKLLEKAAYRLSLFLSRAGYKALGVPRSSTAERAEPAVSFFDVWAGHYAGLGTVGWNHALLTREYGPRLQLKSILTDLELTGDPLVEGGLCRRCFYCRDICPAQALGGDGNSSYAGLNEKACLQHEQRLQKAFCAPCHSCIKVCPVGEDRQLFQSNNFKKYFAERGVLAQDPDAEEYRDWVHIRSYGSYSLEELPGKGANDKDGKDNLPAGTAAAAGK